VQIKTLGDQSVVAPAEQVAGIGVNGIRARVHDGPLFVGVERADDNHVLVEPSREVAGEVEKATAVTKAEVSQFQVSNRWPVFLPAILPPDQLCRLRRGRQNAGCANSRGQGCQQVAAHLV
jgi:hypothetical protein